MNTNIELMKQRIAILSERDPVRNENIIRKIQRNIRKLERKSNNK